MRLALGMLADMPAAGVASAVGDNAATARHGNGTALARAPRLAHEAAAALGGALARGLAPELGSREQEAQRGSRRADDYGA